MDVLRRLQEWYAAHCDGDWEHQFGVRIETLDNPGWLVKIDLADTELQGLSFKKFEEGLGSDSHPEQSRWVACSIRDRYWEGACDETQLARLLKIFLESDR